MKKFFKKEERKDEKFINLLRKAVGDPNLWVPGVGNGGIEGVLDALNSLDDVDIIRIIRIKTEKSKFAKVDLEKKLSEIEESVKRQTAGDDPAYSDLYYAYVNAYYEVCELIRKNPPRG